MSMGYWTIPRLWNGETAVVLGGGPSLKTLDLALLKGKRVVAVNCAYKLGDFDAVFFGDTQFAERYGKDLESWPGLKVTRRDEYLSWPWIHVVQELNVPNKRNGWPENVHGISINPGYICWNKSSGATAINLATLLGAGRIVLVGFDMHTVCDKHNWHEFYPDNDAQAHTNDYGIFLGPFGEIQRDLHTLGIDCINATPGSSLTLFPIMTPEEALC